MAFFMKCRTSYLRIKILGNKELLGRSENCMRTQPYTTPPLQSLFFLTLVDFPICVKIFCIDCSSKYILTKYIIIMSLLLPYYYVKIQFQCTFFKKLDGKKLCVLGKFFFETEKPNSCKFFCKIKKFINIYVSITFLNC